MEPTERKEQLRKKFEDFLKPAPAQFHSLHRSDVFDFFWKEIESRDRLVEAADEVIELLEKTSESDPVDWNIRFEARVEKYNQLKQQSKT